MLAAVRACGVAVRRLVTVCAAAVAAGLVLLSGAGAAGPEGWTTYGRDAGRSGAAAEALPPSSVRPDVVLPIRGRVTSQVLAARDVPKPGLTTLYVATSAGVLYALGESGYVRWRVDLGRLPNACPQLDGYGVTGTPAIDAASRSLFVADALGRLHDLDLATGAERPGWPVTLYSDPGLELVWGALALADGHVYVPTGSYCDGGPFVGKVISVDVATQAVSTWQAVPPELGGGGGIWGWGGVAYSRALDRLYVATGNAFEGGTNTGDAFSEAAGYGEAVVSLDPALGVVGASHPASVDEPLDLDLVGSPVVAERPGCGPLVFAHDKNAELFGWHADAVGGQPLWTVALEPYNPDNPVLSQLAWDPKRNALFAVTGSRIVRVDVAADCSASVRWSRALGTDSLNGSPTVSGDAVWFGLSGSPRLVAFGADTGVRLASLPLPGLVVAAPTVVDGRIVVGTFTGQFVSYRSSLAGAVAAGPPAPAVAGHSSWLDRRHGWVSREDGVWATEDGGGHWRRVFGQAASEVLRTSPKDGLIRVPSVESGCTCTRTLYTVDNGAHWVPTRAVAGRLVGKGRSVYWVGANGTEVEQIAPWPPVDRLRSHPVASTDGATISDLALIQDGVAALVQNPSSGAVSVLVVNGAGQSLIHLPQAPGALVTTSLSTSGSALVVAGTVFAGGTLQRVRWSSDGDGAWDPSAS